MPNLAPLVKAGSKGVDAIVDALRTFKFPQDEAMALAQQRAALPRSQGGLGLPADNTAMQRARAMGFETAPSKQTFHGTQSPDILKVDPSLSDLGFHTGRLEQAEKRLGNLAYSGQQFPEGANVMPLMVNKYANMLKVADEGTFHADALAPQFAKKKLLDKQEAKQIVKDIDADWKMRKVYDPQMRNILENEGYQGIKYANTHEGTGTSFAFTNPDVLRSQFAAFDPWRKTAATAATFGVAAPDLLAEELRKK